MTPAEMSESVANWLTSIEGIEANFHGQAKAELLAFKNRLIQFLDAVGRLELLGVRGSEKERQEMLKGLSAEFGALLSQARKLGLAASGQLHGDAR